MPRATSPEPTIEVNANAGTEAAASRALATTAANAGKPLVETPDPRLDGAAPGEVFARTCPSCSQLKMTADQSGKSVCRRCRVKAGEPYEGVALPPPPETRSGGILAPAIEVSRVDRIPLDE